MSDIALQHTNTFDTEHQCYQCVTIISALRKNSRIVYFSATRGRDDGKWSDRHCSVTLGECGIHLAAVMGISHDVNEENCNHHCLLSTPFVY